MNEAKHLSFELVPTVEQGRRAYMVTNEGRHVYNARREGKDLFWHLRDMAGKLVGRGRYIDDLLHSLRNGLNLMQVS